jgi:[protein-PII] uridylyltransferase
MGARLAGKADGWLEAKRLCAAADDALTGVFETAAARFEANEGVALLATGGYGRGELAPFSDLDLLFLRGPKSAPRLPEMVQCILHALWDQGLKVGYATRTIEECLSLARGDHTIETALLEARFVAGDGALAQTLLARFRKEVASRDHSGYIARKLQERDARHARIGASRYMVEPNIKEGKGGLRDLHTLGWMAGRRYGFASAEDYVAAGVFRPEQALALQRARRFLWTVRCHLHLSAGRAEERLTFDRQPEMARRMGYAERTGRTAVERFMHCYFLAANEVGALTRTLCAKLEADHAKPAPRGLQRLLPRRAVAAEHVVPGFRIEGGRVSHVGPEVFDNPANLVRLFEIADADNLDIAPAAIEEAGRRARRAPASWRTDEAARASFLNVVASPRQPGAALRRMNDAGVLGRFVPEFGRIVAQMQFNMYHHYTVDEHTLYAIEAISEIEQGRHSEQHPLATSIFPKIINRRALYLAMFLHDTGKGAGDQQEEGAKTALTACQRLGLPGEEAELVAWLVRHHLVMSDIAQKRDITDPRTVSHFAKIVGSVERLRLLLVLTVADMRAVGPGVWNDWKGQLLRDLYSFTEATLHGGRSGEEEVRLHLAELADAAKVAVGAIVRLRPGMETWLSELEDGYWLSHDADALNWHAEQVAAAREKKREPHVGARVRPRQGVTEVLVFAPDRQGLFASLAAAISSAGANIASARVHTTRSGEALDVFSIQTADRRPFGLDHGAALTSLSKRLRAAALTDAELPPPAAASKRAAAFAIEPWVRIDDLASPNATVIEASGRDRLGLLAELAKICAEANVSIVSAHIDTLGERASDVFYVQELGGGKISDVRRGVSLRSRLEAALRAGEPTEALGAVGRASTAR